MHIILFFVAALLFLPFAILFFPVVVLAAAVIWAYGPRVAKLTTAIAVLAAAAQLWWVASAAQHPGQVSALTVQLLYGMPLVIAAMLRPVGRRRRIREQQARAAALTEQQQRFKTARTAWMARQRAAYPSTETASATITTLRDQSTRWLNSRRSRR